MSVLIGVDIGQKRDPTAVCVAVPENRTVERRSEMHFLIRHLERLPLGTPYPAVVARIGEIATKVRQRTGTSPVLYVDATGVGKPIVDMLRDGAPAVRAVIAVYFTHGDRRGVKKSFNLPEVTLGKAYLVSRLQALFQTGRLHLPRGREPEALRAELIDYEIRVDENAHARFGAFKVGTHDDLVTALGLAVQVERPEDFRGNPPWAG